MESRICAPLALFILLVDRCIPAGGHFSFSPTLVPDGYLVVSESTYRVVSRVHKQGWTWRSFLSQQMLVLRMVGDSD